MSSSVEIWGLIENRIEKLRRLPAAVGCITYAKELLCIRRTALPGSWTGGRPSLRKRFSFYVEKEGYRQNPRRRA